MSKTSDDGLAISHGEAPPALEGTATYDPKVLKRALLKLDCIFLPALTLVYLLNFLDRANIGNAKAAGIMVDLGLTNRQYSIALTMTYVPYIIAELPLTLLVKKVGPNILIPVLVVLWGTVTTFQGFIHNYAGLLAARFFLGACEGAILPASMTYMTTMYRRQDFGKRCAFYFSATSLAGAFSGLLAAAILNMEGLAGKRGWQWIFIIEGIITVVCGVLVFPFLPRGPDTVWYLTHEERLALVAALHEDVPPKEEHQTLSLRAVLSALKAPQVWFMSIQFFCSGTMLFAMAYFSPTIVGAIGYKGIKIQLYSVPPYVVSTFVAFSTCYYSDHIRHRGLFVVMAACLSIIGYGIYLGTAQPKALYASLFFQVMGAYVSAPLTSTWMANNLAPFYRRATGIVIGFIVTNSGGILSTWLFPTTEGPRYRRGTSVLVGMACGMGIGALGNIWYLSRENRKRARMLAEMGETPSGMESDVENEKADGTARYEHVEVDEHGDGLGDLSLRYRYIT